MINSNTFTRDWILSRSTLFRRGNKSADPVLIEKVIIALHLLEHLAQSGLEFIFKGGTALLLLLDKMHRFSIDLDIIVEKDKNEINIKSILSQIVEESIVFINFEEDIRRSSNTIPKSHYKIYYQSSLDGSTNYVILDILFSNNCYSNLIKKKIDCKFIDCVEPSVFVNLPSTDCMLGDKLTAFAPNTTGIPFGKDKEMEIIKQLFDVANLFDNVENLEIALETFIKTVNQELKYRNKEKELSYKDVLDDIYYTSRIISERGRIEKDIFNMLQKGITRVRSFIFSKNYILERAINSTSKAAYISQLMKNKIYTIEKYHQEIDVLSLSIRNPEYSHFKTIMKFDPEAYFYWYKTFEIININSI